MKKTDNEGLQTLYVFAVMAFYIYYGSHELTDYMLIPKVIVLVASKWNPNDLTFPLLIPCACPQCT